MSAISLKLAWLLAGTDNDLYQRVAESPKAQQSSASRLAFISDALPGHDDDAPQMDHLRDFPGVQLTLLSASIVGILLVVFVFSNDTTPWTSIFAWKVLARNISAAFLFFLISDVVAQILPMVICALVLFLELGNLELIQISAPIIVVLHSLHR
jgi:hypothetical protein